MKIFVSKNRFRGLTLLELLVVIAAIAIFMAVLLPANPHGRHHAMEIRCVNNLKKVGAALSVWHAEEIDKPLAQVSAAELGTVGFPDSRNVATRFAALSNKLQTTKILVCPSDERCPATNFATDLSNSKISYFIGVNADESDPTMFLSGDRNITNGFSAKNGLLVLTTNQGIGWTHELHNCQGNLVFADGHIGQLTTRRLRQALQATGVATNRLAIP